MSGERAALATSCARNPFYLLSAASMLLGCYLVSGAAAHDGSGRLLRVLPLVGWLTLYELLLIGLAAYLARRRAVRDALVLVVLAAVFVVDPTHLGAETIAASHALWPVWTLVFGSLAALKLGLVCRGLGLRMAGADTALLAVPLGLVFGLSGVASSLRAAGVALDRWLYAAWWLIGLVLVFEAVWPRVPALQANSARIRPAAGALAATLRIALPVSLVGHVCAAYWVYDVHLPAAVLTPLLLAFGLFVVRAPGARQATRLRALVPLVAAVLSCDAPPALVGGASIAFSPLRAALLAGAVLYLYDHHRHRGRFAATASVVFLAIAAGGPTLRTAYDRWVGLGAAVARRVASAGPRGAVAWGSLAIAASYALLGLGAWRSLRQPGAGAPPHRR